MTASVGFTIYLLVEYFKFLFLDQKLMGNVKHIYRNPNIVKKSSTNNPIMTKNRIEKEDSYEEILLSKESAANKMPGVYINNDYDITTADNSDDDEDTDITDGPRSSQDQGDHDDDKLIYSSEEKMMISITGNTESIFSNKLRIEVNNKNDDKKNYTPMTGNQGLAQSRVWTNFAGADIRKNNGGEL